MRYCRGMTQAQARAASARHPSPTANEDILLRERRGAVMILTLNRPAARNSLSDALLAALQAAIDDCALSKRVRAVVITGSGAVFSAGHDLKEMTGFRQEADSGRARFEATMQNCATLMRSISL